MAAQSYTAVQHTASVAENVADEFSRYKSRLPEARLEVMAVVAGLYGFSASLYQFDSAVKSYTSLDHDILGQLNVILKGSSKALKDVERMVKRMEVANALADPAFASAWTEVSRALKDDNIKLQDRFESFKERMSLLLANLNATTNRKIRNSSRSRADFSARVAYHDGFSSSTHSDYQLTLSPGSESSEEFNFLPNSPIACRRGSFSSRAITNNYCSNTSPRNHAAPYPHRRRSLYMPHMQSDLVQYVDPSAIEFGSDGSNSSQTSRDIYQSYLPPVKQKAMVRPRRKSQPDLSKLLIDTHISEKSPRRRTSIGKPEHWASKVYSGVCSESSFPPDSIKLASRCFGKNMVVKQDVCEEELLKMRFSADFVARIWRDESSHRARIVCQDGNKRASSRLQSTIDLSYLSICRTGAALELRFRETLWAVLSFNNMEDLVVFYMTFLALRQLGQNPPRLSPSEIFLDDEDLLYSGFISDDEGGEHHFRVLQDRESGAVRISAFIKGGDMQDLPVWTSFINDSIHSKGWLNRHGARIRLGSINLISFSDMYTTSTYQNWELLFTGREDAKDFEHVLKIDLRQRV